MFGSSSFASSPFASAPAPEIVFALSGTYAGHPFASMPYATDALFWAFYLPPPIEPPEPPILEELYYDSGILPGADYSSERKRDRVFLVKKDEKLKQILLSSDRLRREEEEILILCEIVRFLC